MKYLLGVILFGVVTIILTMILDGFNNRDGSSDRSNTARLAVTAINLGISFVVSLIMFVVIGLDDAGIWLMKLLNL